MSDWLISEMSLFFNKYTKVDMYASPNADVIATAVDAAIAPPAKVPTPGMNLSKFETIDLPIKVAPPAVMVEETRVDKNAFFNSKPKTAVILANIPT